VQRAQGCARWPGPDLRGPFTQASRIDQRRPADARERYRLGGGPLIGRTKVVAPSGSPGEITLVPGTAKTEKARKSGPFLSSGGRIRTCDLRVMSPTSYQTAPPRGGLIVIADVKGFRLPRTGPKPSDSGRSRLPTSDHSPSLTAGRPGTSTWCDPRNAHARGHDRSGGRGGSRVEPG
jgi:hypothetical protein